MRLGATTDTQDATGRVLTRSTGRVGPDEVIRVLHAFVGSQTQIPPMYSAVKVGGVPLYKAARAGRVVERQPRPVTIARLQVLGVAEDEVTFDVTCSKGTYVRTLCADAGERLGVGAHMQALERRRVGAFGIDQALTMGELEAAARDGTVGDRVVSIDQALSDMPAAEVDSDTAERACHGVAVPAARVAQWLGSCRAGGVVRIRTKGVTVALATAPADHATLRARESGAVLRIDRVLRDRESKVSSVQGLSQGSARSR